MSAVSNILKLSYFPFTGRGFVPRVCFALGGVAFIDEYVNGEDLENHPDRHELFPLGSLPTLTLPTGKVITQSKAIARYAAKLAKLYPLDDDEAALAVDEVIDICDEVFASVPHPPSAAAKEEARKQYIDVKVHAAYELLGRRLSSSHGPFLLGEQLSVADICIYNMFKLMHSGFFDYIPRDFGNAYAPLQQLVETMEKLPEFVPYATDSCWLDCDPAIMAHYHAKIEANRKEKE